MIHEKQTLIRLVAKDGFVINSLLVTKDYEKKENILGIPILLQVHGLLGHFLSRGTPRLLPHALLEHNYSSLSINTRLASTGQITGKGIFPETILDIDAAVHFLTEEGFRNIFILGYSLGACIGAYWAAHREPGLVKGLILEGAPYSFPDCKKRLYDKYGSYPSYEEIYQKAKAGLGDEPFLSSYDESLVIYRACGPSSEPVNSEIYTYKTWWFMAGPEAHGSMTYKHISRINLPLLFITGENDQLVESWEAEALAQLARDAGNHEVKVKQISGAGHDCMENEEEMVQEIMAMFSQYAVD